MQFMCHVDAAPRLYLQFALFRLFVSVALQIRAAPFALPRMRRETGGQNRIGIGSKLAM
jgi:hypothetical protein